jgi:hypothetical protein
MIAKDPATDKWVALLADALEMGGRSWKNLVDLGGSN